MTNTGTIVDLQEESDSRELLKLRKILRDPRIKEGRKKNIPERIAFLVKRQNEKGKLNDQD